MSDEIKEDFTGEDLKIIRLKSGKTTQQMADLVEIHRNTYENYEKDISKIPLEYFLVWTRICGISLTSIFTQVLQCRKAVNESEISRIRQKGIRYAKSKKQS